MTIPLQIRGGTVWDYPQNGDEDYGVDGTGWASDVTTAVNLSGALNGVAQFDYVMGSAAQVASGQATHSNWATMLAAASAGDSVYVLAGTYTFAANFDITKRLTIINQSYDCIYASTAAFPGGAMITFSADGTTFFGGSMVATAGTCDYCFELDADRCFISTATEGYATAAVQFTSGRATSLLLVKDVYCSNIEGRWGFGTNAAQNIMRFFGSDGDGTALDDSAGLRSANGVIQFKDRGGNWTGFAAVVSANTALSNLGATAINANLIPDADSTYDLGANLTRWAQLFSDSVEGDTGAFATSVDGGNINVAANTISSTNVDGDIVLTPNGDGSIEPTITGDGDLTIDLAGTGAVAITTTSGDVSITPATGDVNIIPTAGTTVIYNVDSYETSTDTITAHAGGGQGAATALTTHCNRISVCATAADSVVLPAVFAAGYRVTVRNDGAERADLFPASGDTINGMAADTAIQVLPGQTMELIGHTANSAWRVY